MKKSYLDEILEQPDIIKRLSGGISSETLDGLRTVGADIMNRRIDRVIVTGMGGSLHGAYAFTTFLNKSLPVPVNHWDAAEFVQQAPNAMSEQSAVVAISQSGESAELVRITTLRQRPHVAISVTNGPDNTLSAWSDLSLCTHAGPERTVSTKSYTAGLAALHLLGGILTGVDWSRSRREVETAGEASSVFLKEWQHALDDAVEFLNPRRPICFVGRGYSHASALMSALLTQEAAKLHSTAYTGGQFRHGPLELVRDGFSSVFFFGSRYDFELNDALAKKVLSLGGRVLAIASEGNRPEADPNLRIITYGAVADPLAPILEILPIQLLQISLSIARGFEPGAFLNASKVTTEE